MKQRFDASDTAMVPIWMADSFLAGCLIGCGLSCAERKRLLLDLDISADRLTDFEVYELLVHAVKDENLLSREIDRALREKLESEAAVLRAQDEMAFLTTCRTSFACDVSCPELWVAATRPGLSPASRHELMGLVQMAMFESLREVRSFRRDMAKLSQRNEQQARKIRDLSLKMEREREEREREILELRDRETAWKTQVAKAAGQQHEWNDKGSALERENAELHEMLEEALDLQTEQETKIRTLLEELERMRSAHAACPESCPGGCPGCTEQCPAFDLCRKRVLIVGGVERMEPQYRTLVERCGGILDYHDGKMQGGARKLERSLQRADIIICPVNCNSHGACLMVKNLAKKHRKVVHLLPNASISTVTRVFGEVVDAG